MRKDIENILVIGLMVILGGASIVMAVTSNQLLKLGLIIWHILEAYILTRLLLLKIEKEY